MAKRFRILVTGSRKYSDREAFDRVVRAALGQRELSGVVMVSGAAKGLDRIAEDWAKDNGVRVERYPADWDRYKLEAGSKRNQIMIDTGADVCLAFPMKGSIGTYDCIRRAKSAGIETVITRENLPKVPQDDILFDFDW